MGFEILDGLVWVVFFLFYSEKFWFKLEWKGESVFFFNLNCVFSFQGKLEHSTKRGKRKRKIDLKRKNDS